SGVPATPSICGGRCRPDAGRHDGESVLVRPGHVVSKGGEEKMTRRVVSTPEHTTDAALVRVFQLPDELVVFADDLPHLFDDFGETLVPVEHDGHELLVPPGGVLEELAVQFPQEVLGAVPDEALGEEDVPVQDTDQDVGVTDSVESLPGSGPLEKP